MDFHEFASFAYDFVSFIVEIPTLELIFWRCDVFASVCVGKHVATIIYLISRLSEGPKAAVISALIVLLIPMYLSSVSPFATQAVASAQIPDLR